MFRHTPRHGSRLTFKVPGYPDWIKLDFAEMPDGQLQVRAVCPREVEINHSVASQARFIPSYAGPTREAAPPEPPPARPAKPETIDRRNRRRRARDRDRAARLGPPPETQDALIAEFATLGRHRIEADYAARRSSP